MQRRKGLFDWPVAFTKVRLMLSNCTLAVFRGAVTCISRIVTVYQREREETQISTTILKQIL